MAIQLGNLRMQAVEARRSCFTSLVRAGAGFVLVTLVHSVAAGQAGAPGPAAQQPAAQPKQPVAQEPPAGEGPRKDEPSPAAQTKEGAKPDQPPARPVGDTGIEQRDYMQGEQPPPPTPPQPGADEDSLAIARGAGAGSPLSYARRGVVELGGTLAFTHESETTTFRISQSIGYFFIDGLELTLFPELQITNVDDEADVQIAAALEPSYHLALGRSGLFYGFAGIGIGLSYADEPGADLFLRPRVGLDIMIGRSGILKPAAFLDVGVSDGATAGGFEAGFTVMW